MSMPTGAATWGWDGLHRKHFKGPLPQEVTECLFASQSSWHHLQIHELARTGQKVPLGFWSQLWKEAENQLDTYPLLI